MKVMAFGYPVPKNANPAVASDPTGGGKCNVTAGCVAYNVVNATDGSDTECLYDSTATNAVTGAMAAATRTSADSDSSQYYLCDESGPILPPTRPPGIDDDCVMVDAGDAGSVWARSFPNTDPETAADQPLLWTVEGCEIDNDGEDDDVAGGRGVGEGLAAGDGGGMFGTGPSSDEGSGGMFGTGPSSDEGSGGMFGTGPSTSSSTSNRVGTGATSPSSSPSKESFERVDVDILILEELQQQQEQQEQQQKRPQKPTPKPATTSPSPYSPQESRERVDVDIMVFEEIQQQQNRARLTIVVELELALDRQQRQQKPQQRA